MGQLYSKFADTAFATTVTPGKEQSDHIYSVDSIQDYIREEI